MPVNKTFRLYDSTMVLVIIGLIYFTYITFTDDRQLATNPFYLLNLALVWILFLFKIHMIKVPNQNTLIFKGVFRKIQLNPNDIVSFQDLLRGVLVVTKNKSIILWPFIDRQGEFKSLLKNLNPEIKFVDVSELITNYPSRAGLLLLGLFVYFGGLIGFLFWHFTHNIH